MTLVETVRESPGAAVVFASTLVAVMGVSLVSPALPAIQRAWGISESEASLLISAFTLPIGVVTDRVGRKPVLLVSLVAFGASGGAIVAVFVVLFGAQLTAVPFVLDDTYRLASRGIGLLPGIPAVTMGLTATQGDRIRRALSSYQSIADAALTELAPDEMRGSVVSVRTTVPKLATTVGRSRSPGCDGRDVPVGPGGQGGRSRRPRKKRTPVTNGSLAARGVAIRGGSSVAQTVRANASVPLMFST